MGMYKLLADGVLRTADNASIPDSTDNRDWRKYQEWLAEGNTPDPQYTQEEIDAQALGDEIVSLKQDLTKANVWQFRMLLELFEVGKTKGLWVNTDFDATLRQKAADWKTKLERLGVIDE
jgi:hypothetical protein